MAMALILVARRADRLEQMAAQAAERRYGVDGPDDRGRPGRPRERPPQFTSRRVARPSNILINNAGFGLRGRYDQTDWEAEAPPDAGQYHRARRSSLSCS